MAQAGWDANDKEGRALLESAWLGYEKVYQAQRSYFSRISEHSRGELLFGLASGWSILGEHKKAQFYLGQVIKKIKGSSYAEEARKWLGKAGANMIVAGVTNAPLKMTNRDTVNRLANGGHV